MLLPAATPPTIPAPVIKVSLPSCVQAFRGALCILIAIFIPTQLRAQEPRGQHDGDEVIKVNTDLLVYPIRVRDKRGPAATTLTEHDLLLKDIDHVTAGIFLYHGADRVALVFALDQSGSLQGIVSEQREAALALVGRFGDRSQVAVIRFAEQPSLVVPFGRDTSAAREAFSFSARVNQHTAIFDAAAAAVDTFAGLPQVRSERRIVVLISDGLDNASRIKPGSVIQSAMRNRVSFYVIHLPLFEPRDGRLAVRSPAKGFRELAEKTGGKYFLVGDSRTALAPQANNADNDLTPIFQAIEDDLRSQYLLGVYAGAGARDGRTHRFTIGLPAGVEYQVGGYGYSRSHEFFHVMPREP